MDRLACLSPGSGQPEALLLILYPAFSGQVGGHSQATGITTLVCGRTMKPTRWRKAQWGSSGELQVQEWAVNCNQLIWEC